MKPVAILRHSATEGPGYCARYLDAHRIPWRLLKVDAGDAVPGDPDSWSGLVFMGGPMSVNDDLPWIGQELALIRQAVEQGVPTLGHCLGGQLMAKALGGSVSRNPVKEIGWGTVSVPEAALAQRWFGGIREFLAFHWHGETFSIPPGATRVLENANCANQGFALGKHLGMQCHVEMTEELVKAWLESGADEMRASAASPAVHKPEEIERDLRNRLEALNEVANRIYDRWTAGLSR